MKLASLRRFGAALALAGLALFAVASPASAAPAPFTNPSISMTGDTPTSGTNASPVVATMTTNDATTRVIAFQANQWTFVQTLQQPVTCPGWFTVTTTSQAAGTPTCQTGFNGGLPKLMLIRFPNDLASGTTVTLSIAAGELTASAAGQQFYLFSYDANMAVLNFSTVNLPAPPAPAPAPGPAPAPAADPTLATTGSDTAPWMIGAATLLTAGAGVLFATRRRKPGAKVN